MPARYLPEGNPQDHHQSSPSPRSYTNAREVPALYPQHYGYPISGAFAHHDPRAAPAAGGGAGKSCQASSSSSSAACNSSKTAGTTPQFRQGSSSESPAAMWRNNDSSSIAIAAARPDLFHGEASNAGRPTAVSVSAPSRSPSPAAVSGGQQHRDHPAVELTSSSSPAKKSDWENLLGAVDLELRAQERAELVPDSTTTTAVPSHHYAHAINAAHLHHQQQQCSPLHPSSVGDGNRYTQSAAVSPEFGPIKAAPHRHHRRGGGGGDGISGGGPLAYSGSTADAASLLATLPQRMLDRASKLPPTANAPAVGISSGYGMGMMPSHHRGGQQQPPALVSASCPPVTPVRVQASGRRGPRGQSRFKGVCITRAGKWRAVIYIGRKQKYLGVFDSEFDAARAYDAAALEHFAEGAKLNFPDGIEQQLNDISSGDAGRPFATAGAGAGGPAPAPRSATPPAAFLGESMAAMGPASGGKRNRKSAFGDHDDDEWVREAGPWNSSRI